MSQNEKPKKNRKFDPKILLPFLKSHLKIVISITITIVVAVIAITIIDSINKGKMHTVTESSLQKVIEISELSTAEYTYNAIATKTNDKGDAMYYVAYEGKVDAGIDFDKIDFKLINTEEEKKIIIMLPEISIQKTTVDMGTLEFIFTKNKYETETVSQEAYKLCKEDLANRVVDEETLLTTARENVESTINALLKPWLSSLEESYEIVFEHKEDI